MSKEIRYTNYSSRTADKFVIRFPERMRSAIAAKAKENHMSMNNYIIHHLDNVINNRSVTQVVASPKPKFPTIGQIVIILNSDGVTRETTPTRSIVYGIVRDLKIDRGFIETTVEVEGGEFRVLWAERLEF